MAVEDHPQYPKWRAALERLIDAVQARKEGRAVDAEVNEARKAFYKIADEI